MVTESLKMRFSSEHPMKKTLTAVLQREENMYVAQCPEVGTVSQGHTVEEAVENLKEATEAYLEEMPLEGVSRSLVTTFEVTMVDKT